MVTLYEKVESRETITGDNPSVIFHYILDGTSDDISAKTLLEGSTPLTYDSLDRGEMTLDPIVVDSIAGTGKWNCTVRYGAAGITTISFDTGGGTQHITQSISTIGKYPLGTAPDFDGAIGATHDSIEGIDITVPVYHFAETHFIKDVDVNQGAYFAATGTVNDAAFKGFAIGECLFLGATGSVKSAGIWEITFRFAASPNKTNIAIGSIIVAAKKGWEYLWVRYESKVDAASKTLVKQPLAAYVEQVYASSSFLTLGIGV